MHTFLMFLWRPQEYSNIFPYNRTTLEMNIVRNNFNNNVTNENNKKKPISFVNSMKSTMKSLSSSPSGKPQDKESNKDHDGMQLIDVDNIKLRKSNKNNELTHHPRLRFRGTVVQLRDHLKMLYGVTDELEKSIDDVFDGEGDEAFTPGEKKDDEIGNDFSRSSYVNMK